MTKSIHSLLFSLFVFAVAICRGQLTSIPVFELTFPYATEWTHPQYGGLGNGPGDFDQDGQVNDLVRGKAFGSPTSVEYKTSASFTSPGPSFTMRAMAAALNTSVSATAPEVGSHGVTQSAFRMEALWEKSSKFRRMGYAGWLLFDASNFTERVQLSQPHSVTAEVRNTRTVNWRLLLKAGGVYYVSAAVSEGDELEIADLAEAEFIEYRQAENGRSLRLIPENGKRLMGRELGTLGGIGVYAEKAEYDGTQGESPRLEITQLRVVGK